MRWFSFLSISAQKDCLIIQFAPISGCGFDSKTIGSLSFRARDVEKERVALDFSILEIALRKTARSLAYIPDDFTGLGFPSTLEKTIPWHARPVCKRACLAEESGKDSEIEKDPPAECSGQHRRNERIKNGMWASFWTR